MKAIENYKVDAVVANELQTRRTKVIVYDALTKTKKSITVSEEEEEEIEKPLVDHVITLFNAYHQI